MEKRCRDNHLPSKNLYKNHPHVLYKKTCGFIFPKGDETIPFTSGRSYFSNYILLFVFYSLCVCGKSLYFYLKGDLIKLLLP